MAFTSIALILLSAFCHALWNFYSKSSRDTRVLFFWCGFYTIVIAFIAFGIKQPVIPKPVWIYIAASAFVHLLYKLSLTHAYTVGEISFVYPIARAAPAFLPLFAFIFLKERISVPGLIGILCVMASMLLYQQREARIQFKAFFRFLRQPDALLAYATLASVIGYSLIDKQGMSEFHRHSTGCPDVASRDLLSNGEQYLASPLRCVLPRSVSAPADCTDRTNGMEAGTRYCWTLVGILFTHPLRLDDGEGQLRNSGSAVFRNFRCSARWIRLERNLYKTSLDCGCCDDLRHLSDCQFLIIPCGSVR